MVSMFKAPLWQSAVERQIIMRESQVSKYWFIIIFLSLSIFVSPSVRSLSESVVLRQYALCVGAWCRQFLSSTRIASTESGHHWWLQECFFASPTILYSTRVAGTQNRKHWWVQECCFCKQFANRVCRQRLCYIYLIRLQISSGHRCIYV